VNELATEALPAFLLAIGAAAGALAFARASNDPPTWRDRPIWPKGYNAVVLQGFALLLAAYAGIRA
jgi:hypothetical protein